MALVPLIDNYYFDHKKIMFCSYQITLTISIIVSETACSHEN